MGWVMFWSGLCHGVGDVLGWVVSWGGLCHGVG